MGEVFLLVLGGRAFLQRAAVAPDWWGGKRYARRAERYAGCSVSLEGYIPMKSADLSPLISRYRDSFPPRGSLLQDSFCTTQQDKRARI